MSHNKKKYTFIDDIKNKIESPTLNDLLRQTLLKNENENKIKDIIDFLSLKINFPLTPNRKFFNFVFLKPDTFDCYNRKYGKISVDTILCRQENIFNDIDKKIDLLFYDIDEKNQIFYFYSISLEARKKYSPSTFLFFKQTLRNGSMLIKHILETNK